MTNGEKLKEIFPNGVLTSINNSYYWGDDILVSKNWWNAEYKEPTNDLGVERQIKEICISYPKSNLKEHDGKPYYSIMYVENGKEHQGYGTYKIEVFMEYLKNYFMPSITPQEPKSEWQQDHEILKAYSDGANEMLDKIRAEIENDWQLKKFPCSPFSCGLRRAIEIIDKYKAESGEE